MDNIFMYQQPRTYFPFRSINLSRVEPQEEQKDPFSWFSNESSINQWSSPGQFSPAGEDPLGGISVVNVKKRKIQDQELMPPSQAGSASGSPTSSPSYCPVISPIPIATPLTLFTLKQQPQPFQRKCYENENRHLKPTPLIVRPINPIIVKTGLVKVDLCDEHGEVVSCDEANLSSAVGLDRYLSENLEAAFKLKLHCKNTTARFRLRFSVEYETIDGEHKKEIILSEIFNIQSNTTLMAKGPHVEAILPTSGNAGCEVWIRGSNFNRKGLLVTFDGVPAEISEVGSEVITLNAPKFFHKRTCKVVVSNVQNNGKKMVAQKTLHFSYL